MPRLGLLLGLLLALPATASAATTYYVSSSGSGAVCSQAAPCATIATAVGKAVDDDTISIAPGTFSDPVDTTKRLTFTGAGPGTAGGADGSTFIDIPGEGGAPAMRLRNGGTVTHMRLRGQSLVNSSSCCGGPGLQVAPDPGPNGIVYTVADVIAIGGKNIAGAAGVSVSNGAAPQRVFSLSVNDGVLVSDEDGLVINATTGYIDVTGTQIDGGVRASAVARAKLSGVHVTAGASIRRGRFEIDHSRLESKYNALFVWGAGGTARAIVRDSQLVAVNPAAFSPFNVYAAAYVLGGDDAAEDSELTAIGSTFYTSGPPLHAALYATRIGDRLGNVEVTLTNSALRRLDADGVQTADIIVGTATNTTTAGTVTLDADHSAFSTVIATGLATASAAGSATNVAGDPRFRSTPAGTLTGMDLSLAADSPLLDRGDASVVTTGELDLPGNPRNVNGDTASCAPAPDIGAYEAPLIVCAPVPTPTPTPTPIATPAPDRTKPVITKAKLTRTKVAFAISEAAKVTATIERATTGRRQGKRCVAKRKRGRKCTRWVRERLETSDVVAGSRSISLAKLGRGRHRVRLVAIDRAGNRSAAVVATLTVK